MVTKSLTQGRPLRSDDELVRTLVKPDIQDEHPRIACAPHLMEGHAHLRSNKVTIQQVLRTMHRAVPDGPLRMSNGMKLSPEDVAAAIDYAVAVFKSISKIYAELGRQAQMNSGERYRGPR